MGTKKTTQYKVIAQYGKVVVIRRRPITFRVRWPESGRRPERSFRSEAEARKFARELATTLEEDGSRVNTPTGLFAELVVDALQASRHPSWSERHARTMEGLARNHVINTSVGSAKTTSVTSLMLTELLQGVVDESWSHSTAAHIRKVLLAAVRRGIELGMWTDANHPLRGVRIPRVRLEDDVPVGLHRITSIPTPTQVQALEDQMEAASPTAPGYSGGGLLVRFAAQTGMRQGEVFALQVKHIDFDRRLVLV